MLYQCLPHYCLKGRGNKCRFDFGTFKVGDEEGIDDAGVRYKFKRSQPKDLFIASYNLESLMAWDGHVNVVPVTRRGWQMYLAKYVAKAATNCRIRIVDRSDKFEGAVNHLEQCPSVVNEPNESKVPLMT